MFFDKMAAIFQIAYGQISTFQIQFKTPTIWNPQYLNVKHKSSKNHVSIN